MADEGRRDQLHPDREVFRPRGGVFLGKQDELIYAYLSDKRRFADLFNAGYFEGRTVVDPAQLEQVSERSQTTADLTEGAGAKMQIPRSYYRDIRMKRRDGAVSQSGQGYGICHFPACGYAGICGGSGEPQKREGWV